MSIEQELQAEIERLWMENARLQETLEALRARRDAEGRIRAVLRRQDDCALVVADVMTAKPDVLHLGDNLRAAVERFRRGSYRRLPVLDAHERLVGIITDRDIRQALNSPFVLHERWQDEMLLNQVLVDVCMTPDPVTVRPETPLYEAARLMRMRKIGGLPVLDDAGKLIGIVTETDLLRAFEEALTAAASPNSPDATAP